MKNLDENKRALNFVEGYLNDKRRKTTSKAELQLTGMRLHGFGTTKINKILNLLEKTGFIQIKGDKIKVV